MNGLFEVDAVRAADSRDGTPQMWHTLTSDEALAAVHSHRNGLSHAEVVRRKDSDGPNILHTVQRAHWSRILLHQFKSLLIWVLVAASILSAVLGEWIDCIAVLAIASIPLVGLEMMKLSGGPARQIH
jgi:Ca2+-transporting ATPase